MITEDLISYIQAQRRKNILDDEISSRLKKAGWYPEDIAEAFQKLKPPIPSVIPPASKVQPQPPVQVMPVNKPIISSTTSPIAASIAMPELEQPQKIEEKFDPYPQPISRPVAMPPPSLPIAPETEVIKAIPPVQPPVNVPPVQLSSLPLTPLAPKVALAPTSIEERRPQPVDYIIPEEPTTKPLLSKVVSQTVSRSPFSAQSPSQVNPVFGSSEDLMPSLIPKVPQENHLPITPPVQISTQTTPSIPQVQSQPLTQKTIPVSKPVSSLNIPMVAPTPKSNSFAMNVPANAVISTYPRDVIAATPVIPLEIKITKKRSFKIFLRMLTAVLIVGGIILTIFLFKSGYITPPFSFIKKDPKVALLSTSTVLNSFESYTATTHASISAPSFANITNGLVTGDRVTSSNTDSISIDALGNIHNGITSNPLSQYSFSIQSSLIKNPVHSDITYNKESSVITVPNLKDIFGEAAPLPGVISVKNTELESLLSLLPDPIADKVRTADVYHMLSKGIPPFVKNNLSASLKQLVQSAHVVDRGQETIEGVITHHYEFTIDRLEVKKFLNSLLDTFVVTLSAEDQKHVDEVFGATTIDTMDIWVGKNDGMTHQYSFSLTTPLSKVLNLDDKGIAGNTVNIKWQTTYGNFNTTKLVANPTGTSPVIDFVKSNTDQNIKTNLEAFKLFARSLYNAEGSYGTRANPTGSCTNPNPSSLFSPVGHAKGATTAVGAIANSMNTLLTLTNGAGSCFSTQAGWAMAFPSMTDSVSSHCVDSTGATTKLTTPLKSIICK